VLSFAWARLPQLHAGLLAVRELDARGLKRGSERSNSSIGYRSSRPLEIHHSGQAEASGSGQLWLREIQERAGGSALSWRHFNIFC
jgi:hypothetical protein